MQILLQNVLVSQNIGAQSARRSLRSNLCMKTQSVGVQCWGAKREGAKCRAAKCVGTKCGAQSTGHKL